MGKDITKVEDSKIVKNNNRYNDSFYNNLNIEQERKILEKYTNKKKYNNKTEPSSINYFSLKINKLI